MTKEKAELGLAIKRIDLWYPGTGPGDDVVDAIDIDLMHVRASRGIRVMYDIDRDGWVISAQVDSDCMGPFVEKAFVPAWEDEIQGSGADERHQ